jgi:acyl-CoA thioesterase
MNIGEPISAERVKEIEQQLLSIPYVKLLGIQLRDISAGVATLALDVRDELKRNNGIAHGGAIASLIDTATAFATISLLGPNHPAITIDLTINFMRPIPTGTATATARVLRMGRRTVVVSAEVFRHDGKPAATALSTYIRE